MATHIEWADDSANAATGCSEARLADGSMSPECLHCYARLMSARQEKMGNHIYDGVAERKGGSAVWTGAFRWDREMLRKRFDAMRPGHRVFLGSMTDLWHPSHSKDLRVALAEEIRRLGDRTPEKRPKVITLTKRAPELLAWQREFFPDGLPEWHWPGVTAGTQPAANERIPVLVQVQAHGPRVVSVEPLLWAVTLPDIRKIGWVIVGGESGSKARPMHPDWARKVRDQCVVAGVPFFFKQWGEWRTYSASDFPSRHDWYMAELGAQEAGAQQHRWDDARIAYRVGKKVAGRLLDGRTWDEVPV